MKKYIVCLLIFLSSIGWLSFLFGQDIAAKNKELNIYIDCSSCDLDYFKENLNIVNYVREPALSDVQILITTINTGSGGLEYNLHFLGRKRYNLMNDTIIFIVSPNQSYEETRSAVLEKLKLGLAPYIMKTSYSECISLMIDNTEQKLKQNRDPWKSWVFDIDVSGSLFNEKFNKNYSLNGSLYAGKISTKMKIESSNYLSYNESQFTLQLTDTVYHFNTYQQGFSSSNLFVISLGEHFGFGGTASFRKCQVSNIDFQMNFGPAVEYNVFKYKDASRKQLRFIYSLGYEHSNYAELTIYNKTYDYLYIHSLSLLFIYIQPWGNFYTSLNGSSFLNDFSMFSLGTNGLASFRITNGLSFNIAFGLSMCRDRIDLRKGNASLDDILSYQREMVSDYTYTINFGISYRFGSKYNNIVNPRFEK